MGEKYFFKNKKKYSLVNEPTKKRSVLSFETFSKLKNNEFKRKNEVKSFLKVADIRLLSFYFIQIRNRIYR